MRSISPDTSSTTTKVWVASTAVIAVVTTLAAFGAGFSPTPEVAGMPIPTAARTVTPQTVGKTLPWQLNNPNPSLIAESRANPVPVADKFAARVRSMDQRAALRAFEGAPPVIPHPVADINVQTCRACHVQGLKTGDKTARMTSHTYLINCTQCHVESNSPFLGKDPGPQNSFVGRRATGYGGTRAWTGAPPTMPHSLFMRTNCVSCHGEFGYDGWRPDHLSRTNCTQCHAPSAELEHLSPTFGMSDVPDGSVGSPSR